MRWHRQDGKFLKASFSSVIIGALAQGTMGLRPDKGHCLGPEGSCRSAHNLPMREKPGGGTGNVTGLQAKTERLSRALRGYARCTSPQRSRAEAYVTIATRETSTGLAARRRGKEQTMEAMIAELSPSGFPPALPLGSWALSACCIATLRPTSSTLSGLSPSMCGRDLRLTEVVLCPGGQSPKSSVVLYVPQRQ